MFRERLCARWHRLTGRPLCVIIRKWREKRRNERIQRRYFDLTIKISDLRAHCAKLAMGAAGTKYRLPKLIKCFQYEIDNWPGTKKQQVALANLLVQLKLAAGAYTDPLTHDGKASKV